MLQESPQEPHDAKRKRAQAILAELERLYPDAAPELIFRNPYQVLISTVLSAQATDKSVNAATPALFARYPDAAALAQASPDEVMPFIKTIGLYRNKAKNITAAARQLVQLHGGQVPNDFEALLALPGVGRKTANVVMANAFGQPALAVDTHVGRLARRLELSAETNPDKVERDLKAIFPEDRWSFVHHAMILHGRRVCTARNRDCAGCGLRRFCPSSQAGIED
jgi:endonuclease-3